jgi:Amt family ammonium transporter
MRIDTGDTAWLLVSAALVLFMSPGLALFYAGMVRRKNVLSTLMHSFSSIPIVLALWLVCGYGLAFGPTHHGLIGGVGASGLGLERLASANHGTVPELAFVAFQMMFAGIAPANAPSFIAAQLVGALAAFAVQRALWPKIAVQPSIE